MDESMELPAVYPSSTAPWSRRDFLRAAGAMGALAGIQRITPAYARSVRNAGPWSAQRPHASDPRSIDLRIRETSIRIGNRRATATAINDMVPGPLLRLHEGDDYAVRVTNGLSEDTSIHWHGLIVPNQMDGVPGVTFPGIRPGEAFTYLLPIRQYGTYWYHSHSGLQEQMGHFGPIIVDPKEPDPFSYDREYVVMLSDWTFENPYKVMDKLKKQSSYYAFQRRTIGDFFHEVGRRGLGATVAERAAWARMRMSPSDISDVTGATYTYLMNGLPPESNWTGLFRPNERVRLRFINAGSGTYFDVRIPGLEMTVVAVSGQYVRPVVTDEIRMEIAQTYDVIVQPSDAHAYTIFAESMDRSGYARGTLALEQGMTASVPKRRPHPVLTMSDMGMTMSGMSGKDMQSEKARGTARADSVGASDLAAPSVAGMNMSSMTTPSNDTTSAATPGMADMLEEASGSAPAGKNGMRAPGSLPVPVAHGPDHHGPANSSTPMVTQSRLHEPGTGLGRDGWRVLVYTELRSLRPALTFRAPEREVELHLTGNMERYMWSIDGVKFSDVKEPVKFGLGERIRLTMVNDTMMSHPMHLHGMWMELENGAGADIPRVHTINVKPAERLSVLITPNDPGMWAFHCHILFHMEMGMFRVIAVSNPETEASTPPHAGGQSEH